VVAGDVIQVRPGERCRSMEQVLSGSSYVDEAMISGEPVPVAKGEGDEVVGGTINKTGSFTYRATKVGADTLLAQIIRMVEEAQGSKLPIQAMVDKVTAWFVPAVIAAAILTFLVWLVFGPEPALTFGLVNAVAVLIIACPCAMGLATPTSIMVGTGRAAEMGVLFRHGAALQTLRSASVVAFDKTGTLTEGRPELTDLELVEGFARETVLSLVAPPRSSPSIPWRRPSSRRREAEGLSHRRGDRLPVDHRARRRGRRSMAAGRRRRRPPHGEARHRRLALRGQRGGWGGGQDAALCGHRRQACRHHRGGRSGQAGRGGAVRALHDLGLKVAMVTGDNARTARAIAQKARHRRGRGRGAARRQGRGGAAAEGGRTNGRLRRRRHQ
jgi:P-type Cu+ transporter